MRTAKIGPDLRLRLRDFSVVTVRDHPSQPLSVEFLFATAQVAYTTAMIFLQVIHI